MGEKWEKWEVGLKKKWIGVCQIHIYLLILQTKND